MNGPYIFPMLAAPAPLSLAQADVTEKDRLLGRLRELTPAPLEVPSEGNR